VARSERKRSEGTGKTSGDGGNTLLKGHDGETAEGGGVRAVRVPRGTGRARGLTPTGGWRPVQPRPGRRAHRRAALSEQGRVASGTWAPAGSGRERERSCVGRVGRPGKKEAWVEPE
jgi:hypothetical protein